MLKIENLHAILEEEEKLILKGVNLKVKPGEVHAIMGPKWIRQINPVIYHFRA